MTASELIDLIRGVLDDDGTTKYWPDADLVQYLDAAEKMFVAVAPDDAIGELQAITITTLPALAAGHTAASFAFPADYFQFRLARVRLDAAKDFRTATLVPIEHLYSQERRDSLGRGDTGNPHVSLWDGKLHVTPASTAAVTTGIQFFYLTTTNGITATVSVPTVNQMHHPVLAEYACYLAWNKIGDTNRSQLHLGNFGNYIQAIGGRWNDRNYNLPEPVRFGPRQKVQ